MQKSNEIGELAKALSVFHVKVDKIRKDANNPFFKSKYASLSNILEAIDLPLIESGLSFTQFPTDENGLTTILMHGESGQWIEGNYKMRPVKDDPQGIGSCITYQRRYALSAILGLNIDDDDDGNRATHGGSTPEKAKENADNRPWLNEGTKEFAGAVEKLKAGTTTIEKIKSVLKVSKATEAKLLAAISNQ
jgi:hypothetical protein